MKMKTVKKEAVRPSATLAAICDTRASRNSDDNQQPGRHLCVAMATQMRQRLLHHKTTRCGSVFVKQ